MHDDGTRIDDEDNGLMMKIMMYWSSYSYITGYMQDDGTHIDNADNDLMMEIMC